MSRIMMTLVILVCAQAFLSLSLAQDLCGSPGWPVPSPPKNMELEQVIVVTRYGNIDEDVFDSRFTEQFTIVVCSVVCLFVDLW